MKKNSKNLILVLFIIYCFVLAFILFFPRLHHSNNFERSYNLLPFATIYEMISRLINQTISNNIVIRNIGVNILLFVPMGIALPILFNNFKKLWQVTLICFFVTALAETIQYIFNLGSFDIDDIILNTFGGIIGYAVFKIPFIEKILDD